MIEKNNIYSEKSNIALKSKAVAIYLRVSTEKQEDNTSKENQLNSINLYIKSNFNNYEVTSIIYDETMSASIPPKNNKYSVDYPTEYDFAKLLHRPQVIRLLNDAKLGLFTDLLVYCHDRLSRDEHELFIIRQTLQTYNINIHYTKAGEQIDSKFKKTNDFIDFALSWLSTAEAMKLSSRATAGGRTCIEKGYWAGGHPPFGYYLEQSETGKHKHSKLKKNLQEAYIVTKIYYLYLNGYTPDEIVDIISSLILYSSNKRKWSTSAILDILKNPTYSGYLTGNKRGGKKKAYRHSENEFVKAPFNEEICIIPLDAWIKARDIRNERAAASKNYSSPFILKNIIKCSYCNQYLETKNHGNNTGRVYFCNNSSCKKVKAIKADTLHELTLKTLERKVLKNIESTNKSEQNYNEYLSLINEQNAKTEVEIKLLEEGITSKSTLIEKAQESIDNSNRYTTYEKLSQAKTQISSLLLTSLKETISITTEEINCLRKELSEKKASIIVNVKSSEEFKKDLYTFYDSYNNILNSSNLDELPKKRCIRQLLLEIFDYIVIDNNLYITIVLK